jgi:hypothetical protein
MTRWAGYSTMVRGRGHELACAILYSKGKVVAWTAEYMINCIEPSQPGCVALDDGRPFLPSWIQSVGDGPGDVGDDVSQMITARLG